MNPKLGELIAVVGPESSGKTTLARHLAERKDGVWLPEYAREFLSDANYTEAELLKITHEQLAREADFIRANPHFGVLDTDGVVLRVWWQERFGQTPDLLESHLKAQAMRRYLVTYPDLPWEFDPRRESKGDLERLFDIYVTTLEHLGFDFFVVTGQGGARTEKALAYIDKLPD